MSRSRRRRGFAFAVGPSATFACPASVGVPGVAIDHVFRMTVTGDDDAVLSASAQEHVAALVTTDDADLVSSTATTADSGLTLLMSTTVDEVSPTDWGAAFQATGGHTLYGGALYFDGGEYLWTSVNGVGVDPALTGTAHEVALTGTAPFTAAAWATAAQTVIAAAGYTAVRTVASIAVSGNGVDPAAAETAQAATVAFTARGEGSVVGSTQQDSGSSTAGNSTGWIQVLPADVPTGAFRVIGIGIRRGSNVGSPVQVSLASGGTANGDMEDAVVDRGLAAGNSGVNAWHYEYFDTPMAYAGSERLFIGTHGDGAASSLFGGGAINDGTFQDGSTNLWLTDGTTGGTTAAVSPVGEVTSSFNFGLAVRLIIQEAPYQSDGGYRVIGGSVPGRHDGTLQVDQTPVDNIFVSWRVQTPDIDDLSLMDTHVWLQEHGTGDSNQIRLELWNPVGGAATMAGDTIVATVGTTSDTQGTGWSSMQDGGPIAVSSNTVYRHSIKGSPEPGEEEDTILGVWLGSAGADVVGSAGHPVYGPAGLDIPDTEREVQGDDDETAIDFDPQTQTASPNPANGTVISPNNLPMIAHHWGKPAPTVTAD